MSLRRSLAGFLFSMLFAVASARPAPAATFVVTNTNTSGTGSLAKAIADAKAKGKLRNNDELKEAIIHGADKRIRPKLMTVAAAFLGLMPVMWSIGTGADMMKRVTAPLAGGLATSFIMELLVYPAIFLLYKRRELREQWRQAGSV